MRQIPVIAATTKTPTCPYSVSSTPLPARRASGKKTLYLSCEDRPVFDEVRAFSRAYDELHQVALPPAPPSVWEPVWCSWYGIKNDVDADYIRSMVPLLKEWGIGNIIVDAGLVQRRRLRPRHRPLHSRRKQIPRPQGPRRRGSVSKA